MVRSLGIAGRILPPRLLLTTLRGGNSFQTPSPQIPVGGRLTHFLKEWENITQDSWVLSVIRGGLFLQFHTLPPLSEIPISLSHTHIQEKHLLLSQEVLSLMSKGAIEIVQDPGLIPGFYSRLFLVTKKTGVFRPVIDLSILNTFLIIPHFKMETNRSIRQCILPDMWVTSLDLTDAYFHIPIAPSCRKYLRSVLDNVVYQFRALPFGLSTALLVFT